MTYNIHKGIGGVDRRYQPERTIETIRKYEPDVVMLQEVDNGVPRSNHHRQVDLLGDALGFEHRAFQENVYLAQGKYGNAILSRFPMTQTWDLDLTIRFKKRRQALIAMVTLPNSSRDSLLLCNSHLGLAGFERTRQLRRLLSFEVIADLPIATPMIIGGDFNDIWNTIGRRFLVPKGFSCAVGRKHTFPAVFPIRRLDALYFRGELQLDTSFAAPCRLAKLASDHLPVIADFRIGAAQE